MAFSIILLGLSCTDSKQRSLDRPRDWPVNESIVLNEDVWALAEDELIDYWRRRNAFREVDESRNDIQSRIEFFATESYWFAAVISKRNDSVGVYRAILGWLRPPKLCWRKVRGLEYELDEKTMPGYLHLVRSDSLWSLFGERGFWTDTCSFEQLFVEMDIVSYEDGQWWQTTACHTIEKLEEKQ